jgi:hypothetical protein
MIERAGEPSIHDGMDSAELTEWIDRPPLARFDVIAGFVTARKSSKSTTSTDPPRIGFQFNPELASVLYLDRKPTVFTAMTRY